MSARPLRPQGSGWQNFFPAAGGLVCAAHTRPGGQLVVPPSGNDPSFYQDVFWALLNSSEFMLNH